MRRFFLATIPFLIILCSCTHYPVEETRFLMDTVVRIAIYDSNLNQDQIQNVIDETYQIMSDLESKVSAHVDTSDISKINRYAGVSSVSVSFETLDLIRQSINISDCTGGTFDVTIGAVKTLWNFEEPESQIPNSKQIQQVLPLVNFRDMRVDGLRIFLKKKGMRLDLGGLAKGFIVDQAVHHLQKSGITSGIVDAGGDLRTFGNHPKNNFWKIAIQNPRPVGDVFYAILKTREKSIATSGDYERYFWKNGTRYHHLLDPQTGYPARGCVSVTIVASNAMLADAYATAVFIMGAQKGMAWLEKTPNIEGLIIYEEEGQLVHQISKGLINDIEIL